MRKIKFRLWDFKLKKMIQPCEVEFDPDGDWEALIERIHGRCDTDEFYCYPGNGEVMQYTGLKDKHGKEIYEGDIVDEGLPNKQRVRWDDELLCFLLDNNDHLDSELEIVGNIYENPDLLERRA